MKTSFELESQQLLTEVNFSLDSIPQKKIEPITQSELDNIPTTEVENKPKAVNQAVTAESQKTNENFLNLNTAHFFIKLLTKKPNQLNCWLIYSNPLISILFPNENQSIFLTSNEIELKKGDIVINFDRPFNQTNNSNGFNITEYKKFDIVSQSDMIKNQNDVISAFLYSIIAAQNSCPPLNQLTFFYYSKIILNPKFLILFTNVDIHDYSISDWFSIPFNFEKVIVPIVSNDLQNCELKDALNKDCFTLSLAKEVFNKAPECAFLFNKLIEYFTEIQSEKNTNNANEVNRSSSLVKMNKISMPKISTMNNIQIPDLFSSQQSKTFNKQNSGKSKSKQNNFFKRDQAKYDNTYQYNSQQIFFKSNDQMPISDFQLQSKIKSKTKNDVNSNDDNSFPENRNETKSVDQFSRSYDSTNSIRRVTNDYDALDFVSIMNFARDNQLSHNSLDKLRPDTKKFLYYVFIAAHNQFYTKKNAFYLIKNLFYKILIINFQEKVQTDFDFNERSGFWNQFEISDDESLALDSFFVKIENQADLHQPLPFVDKIHSEHADNLFKVICNHVHEFVSG